jgi:Flp pilus assembly protein TadG
VELFLVFPILLALLLGMIQFSMTLFSNQQLASASREGARVAALGGDLDEIETTVRRTLGDGRLAEAEVVVVNQEGQLLTSGQQVSSGDAVEVYVRVPATTAVPDLLRFIGYSIKDDMLVGRTVMRRE